MNTRKFLAASAVALALLSLVLAIVHLLPLHREPVPQDAAFSARFQPQPEVLAGIGSTRNLTPVQLDPPKPAQPATRTEVPTEGGRHASAGSQR